MSRRYVAIEFQQFHSHTKENENNITRNPYFNVMVCIRAFVDGVACSRNGQTIDMRMESRKFIVNSTFAGQLSYIQLCGYTKPGGLTTIILFFRRNLLSSVVVAKPIF